MGNVSHNVVAVIPHKSLREMVGELISEYGHKPQLFDNENDAIAKCSGEKFAAAVVVDWELTQKHFPNILENINKVSPYMGRFVMVNLPYKEIREHIDKGDFCCYMQKPFALEKFEKGLLSCLAEYEAKIANCVCTCS
jgi:DNA-binding NtrC family response regulator